MNEAMDLKYVGTRPVRPDGTEKVTGKADYGADISRPGMVHGVVLRSPHAHAQINGIDASEALALEGVYAVVTVDDFPQRDTISINRRRYFEQIIAGG